MKQLDFFGEIGESKDLNTSIFDYHPGLFTIAESENYIQKLINDVSWKQRSVLMYGKEVITPRLTAWFGDPDTDYSIKGDDSVPMPWTKELLEIKARVESLSHIKFNSVLLNYYRDGNDSVDWHNDGNGVPGRDMFVASVSFGQERQFDIRSKTDHSSKFSVLLENGSYLLMKGNFQDDWEHRIAKSKQPMRARVNLTFRIILDKKQ